MFIPLISLLLIAAPVVADPKEPAAKKELFSKENWYKTQKSEEQEFVGTLLFKPRAKGVVGFGRFNPYTLDMGKDAGIREVYVGGKDDLLKEFVGKKVTIRGKAVDMEVEGRSHKEIWPARIEIAADQPKSNVEPKPQSKDPRPRGTELRALAPVLAVDKPADAPKVIASTPSALAIRNKQSSSTVIRSDKELGELMRLDVDKAMESAASRLKVKEIDFSKQMIVIISGGSKPTGGYRVEITKMEVKDGTLNIRYTVKSPPPNAFVTQAFTNPSVSALIDRFEGKVVFEGTDEGKAKRNP